MTPEQVARIREQALSRASLDMRDSVLALCDAYEALRREREWRPMSEAPKDRTSVLLRVPTDNGSDPKYVEVVGFFAPAGSEPMDDCTDDELMNEEGCNAEDAWFEQSASREPYAWMLLYRPISWQPLPASPKETP